MKSRGLWRLLHGIVLLAFALASSGCTLSLVDLADLWPDGGQGSPTAIPGPTATPMPVAQVTFQASLPGPLNPGEILAIALLDEVTGLPLNATTYPMQALDAQTYGVILPLPINAVVKYRYLLTGTASAHEDTGRDQPVRYRLFQVTGSGTVSDVIASWSDRPFSGDAGSLTGKILDSETGAPVPNMMVSFGGQLALTDSTGSFAMSGLPRGTYNLVVYALDGAYQTFQQGARIEKDQITPVELRLAPARMVSVTFIASLPTDTVAGAPVRMAGNLLQLGNTFADLRGGMSAVADRMPVMTRQEDGTYRITLALPVGASVEYKYTMGDGFWNAEHGINGAFQIRRLIVPAVDTLVQDAVASWQAGNMAGPILFEAIAPASTPPGDVIYIQFNPYEWTEPIPMWPQGNNRWVYRLFGPFNQIASFTYRYCRNAQCGRADDSLTAGPAAYGRNASTSLLPQDLQDPISSWTWLQTFPPTTLTGTAIEARPAFVSGIEFSSDFSPDQYAFTPQALVNTQALGANWIVLPPTFTYQTASPLRFDILPGTDPLWSDTALQVGQARALGMNVALFPSPAFPSAPADWWQAAPKDANWWNAWFEQYRRFALQYADLAARNDAQALILGGDWILPALPGGTLANGQSSQVPGDAEARWRVLIGDIRQRYGGQLWWAWPYSPGGFAAAPAFLREVDAVYLLTSLPLNGQYGADRDTVAAALGQMLDGEVLPFVAALQKPVILAFTVPQIGAAGTVDLQAQFQAYEGAFQAVNPRTWISGVVSRGYSSPVILHDGSASIYGTPAADLLWYWLAELRGVRR